MSVIVQCFHCSHVLELDDGFRGGVCRCGKCGALLQVPKGDGVATRGERPAAPTPRPAGPRPASGTDMGISSGKLNPQNHPTGNYRGAADPGLSSGRLHPHNIGQKGGNRTVDAQVSAEQLQEQRAVARRKIRRQILIAAILLALVIGAVIIGIAAGL